MDIFNLFNVRSNLLRILTITISFFQIGFCIFISDLKIHKEDQERLDILFGTLIESEMFGYVLCGEKPIGMTTLHLTPVFFSPTRMKSPGFEIIKGDSLLMNGFKTWEKYQNKFSFSNFKLVKSPMGNCYFINKRAVFKTIKKNYSIFEKEFGKNISPFKLLEMICDPNSVDEVLLHRSNLILGILLGYGAKNAFAYEYREYLSEQLRNPLFFTELKKLSSNDQEFVSLSTLKSRPIKKPQWFPRTRALSKAWDQLLSKIDSFPNEPYEYQENLNITWCLGFLTYNNQKTRNENAQIIKKYRKARSKISDIYRDRKFFENTMKILLNDSFDPPKR